MVQKTEIFFINPFFPSLPCRYFTAEAGNLSAEQLDVCTVTLQALAAACVDNGQILVVLETLHIQSHDYHVIDKDTSCQSAWWLI